MPTASATMVLVGRRRGANELAAGRTVRSLHGDELLDGGDQALVALVVSSAAAVDRELARLEDPEAKTYTLAPAQRVYLAALVELGGRVRDRRGDLEEADSLAALFAGLDLCASDGGDL